MTTNQENYKNNLKTLFSFIHLFFLLISPLTIPLYFITQVKKQTRKIINFLKLVLKAIIQISSIKRPHIQMIINKGRKHRNRIKITRHSTHISVLVVNNIRNPSQCTVALMWIALAMQMNTIIIV